MENTLLCRKSLCVVTGASRGIGKEIAVRFSSNFGPQSHFLLLARSEGDLRSTADEIRKNNSSSSCDLLVCDLSVVSSANYMRSFEEKLSTALKNAGAFDLAFIVHNGGDTGDVSRPLEKVENAEEVRQHFDTNLTSFILLNNIFLRVVGVENAKQRVVINMTSLLAIKAIPGYGLYPVSKAAREAFLRSLSAENGDLRVLNYSPGPVKTAMAEYVGQSTWDPTRRQWWKEALEKGDILTTGQTVSKLLRILDENTFENASHVDYYDIP